MNALNADIEGSLRPGWAVRRLGDLMQLTNGYPFDSAAFGPDGDLPLVRIRDLFAEEYSTYVSLPVPPSVVLKDGDIVIGMDGDFESVRWRRGSAALNQRMCLLRPRDGVDARFIAFALPEHLKVINDLTYATTVKHLSSSDVLAIRLPVPGYSRQRAISDYLDAETVRIDDLVSRYRRLVHLQREKRRAITADGVEGRFLTAGRRLSRLPYLRTIPQHWDEVKLSVLAKLGSGHTPSRSHPEWWVDATIPWITTGEVSQLRDDRVEYVSETRENVSELGIANSAAELHPARTVFLSRTASAGFSGIMARDMATSQDFVTWTCGVRIRPRFLLLCLRAMRDDLLGRLAMGSTHKTIYIPDIQSIRVPVPPVEQQDEIVERVWARLRAIDAVVDAIERQVSLLLERRQAVITAAVSGKLEIPGIAA